MRIFWLAIYEGYLKCQITPEGDLSSERLSRNGIKSIALLKGEELYIVKIDLPKGSNFFYRRRPEIDAHTGMIREVIHILGYQIRNDANNIEHQEIYFYKENEKKLIKSHEFGDHKTGTYEIAYVPSDLEKVI